MNNVLIIPTGIGCSIGGHAGDANPAARLIAAASENLLINPNAVNSSDLNEMVGNMWYVEGSILDRFLDHKFSLIKPNSNKILVVANDISEPTTINSIYASKYTLGTDIEVVELKVPLKMRGLVKDNTALGEITGMDEFIDQIKQLDINFDVIAVHTKIDVDVDLAFEYLDDNCVNPYGGVEAMVSKYLSIGLGVQVAHAPVEELEEPFEGIAINPRQAASIISSCYLNSVLKGLHKAPRITSKKYGKNVLTADDISCLISPINCFGPPHQSCLDNGIPIIMVEENNPKTTPLIDINDKCIIVSNYVEAAGLLVAMRNGINVNSVTKRFNK